jgi:hypothetical protein
MFELKKLSPGALDAALERATHYRLLNHPFLAESICRDILDVRPDSEEAKVTLLLTLCDQFGVVGGATMKTALAVVQGLAGEYERRYYTGIVYERTAFAGLRRGGPGAGPVAYDWFMKAMQHFELAAELRPEGNEHAILRWNTCARVVDARPDVHAGHHDAGPSMLE